MGEATWARQLRLLVSAALLVAGAGCAHETTAPAPTTAKSPADEQNQIVLGPGVYEGGLATTSAWTLYGTIKAGAFIKLKVPAANESADDFAIELEARNGLAEIWAGARQQQDTPPNTELDREVAIWRAGFTPEFVVAVQARPGWTIPPKAIAALRLEEFARRFQGQYAPGAPVVIKPPSGKIVPDVPGADFPDPETLPYGPDSCPLALDARRAAWARWAVLEPKLGGAPVSASSTLDFGHQLTIMQRDQNRVARGATWVAWRVAHLAALEGFCAIEARDWPRAEALLRRAVSMSPASPNPRLELSMAVMMSGRRPEALAIADEVRAWSTDGCAVAAAWRRRGFILIDLNDLQGARDAYQRSLRIDPGNPIALKELASIDEAFRSAPAKEAPPAGLPPSDGIQIRSCDHEKVRLPAGP